MKFKLSDFEACWAVVYDRDYSTREELRLLGSTVVDSIDRLRIKAKGWYWAIWDNGTIARKQWRKYNIRTRKFSLVPTEVLEELLKNQEVRCLRARKCSFWIFIP